MRCADSALRFSLAGHLNPGELNHAVVHALIHDGNDFAGVGLDLVPELQGARVGLEITEVKIQLVGAKQEHILHHLPVDLGFGDEAAVRVGLGGAVGPHAILVGKVAEKVLEGDKRVVDGDGGTPNEAAARPTKGIGLGRGGVEVGERRGIGAVLDDAAGVVEDDTARDLSWCSEGVRVDISTARPDGARPLVVDKQSAALTAQVRLLAEKLAAGAGAGIVANRG